MAEIRRSRFLVADFTEFRTGVFYESGFAKGLGIEVIFTCREDQKDKIKEHFDTRQEKHITWKDEPDLYNQLLNSMITSSKMYLIPPVKPPHKLVPQCTVEISTF